VNIRKFEACTNEVYVQQCVAKGWEPIVSGRAWGEDGQKESHRSFRRRWLSTRKGVFVVAQSPATVSPLWPLLPCAVSAEAEVVSGLGCVLTVFSVVLGAGDGGK